MKEERERKERKREIVSQEGTSKQIWKVGEGKVWD